MLTKRGRRVFEEENTQEGEERKTRKTRRMHRKRVEEGQEIRDK